MANTMILLYGFSNVASATGARQIANNYFEQHKAIFEFGKKNKPTVDAALGYDDNPVQLTFKDPARAHKFMSRELPMRGTAHMYAKWKSVVDGGPAPVNPAAASSSNITSSSTSTGQSAYASDGSKAAGKQPVSTSSAPKQPLVGKPTAFENLFRKLVTMPNVTPLPNTQSRDKVLTNYVQLKKFPKKLFEYHVTVSPIKVLNKDGVPEDRPVKQRSVLQRVFNAFGDLSALNKARWATNYAELWSLEPIHGGAPTENVGATFDTSAFNFERQDGIPVEMPNIQLTCTRVLDLQSVLTSLQGGTNPDDFQCIVTGLNALMTKNITSSTGHNILDPMNMSEYFLHQVGPNKFFHNSGDFRIGHFIGHRGFFTSVRPGEKDMLLNVNVATGCFYPPILLSDFITNMKSTLPKKQDGDDPNELESMLKSLRNLQLRLTYDRPVYDGKTPNAESHRRKFITEVGGMLDSQKYSTVEDPQTRLAVKDFFRDLLPAHENNKHREIYCINVGSRLKEAKSTGKGKNNANQSSTDIVNGVGYENFEKAIWIPSNLLEIVPFQPNKQKLKGKPSDDMVRNACELPLTVLARIKQDGFTMLGINTPQKFNHLDLDISQNLLEVESKILAAPTLKWNSASHQPRWASWNLINRKFVDATSVGTVYVYPITENGEWDGLVKEGAQRLSASLAQGLKIHGLTYSSQNIQVNVMPVAADGLGGHLDPTYTSGPKDVHIFILPRKDKDLTYAIIKSICDRKNPMHTLCCQQEKITGKQKGKGLPNISPDFVSNLCLKICMKLGGAPWHLEGTFATSFKDAGFLTGHNNQLSTKTIILGADLSHPGPVSIAAVVGSIDHNFVNFPGSMRLTPAREEIVATHTLTDMVAERLRAWSGQNFNDLPDRILFYRDGVSESHLEECRNTEITAVKDAWAKVKDELQQAGANHSAAKLELTFVVVVKRHHTRFFPLCEADKTDSKGNTNTNVKPGLIVQQTITMPHYENFYLQSHQAIKGTARSAHYIVLEKGTSVQIDNLQDITHALCYAFCRATKGVSYCAPAYLADRLCDRGSKYLSQWTDLEDFINGVDELKKRDDMSKDELKERDRKIATYLTDAPAARREWISSQSSGDNPWAAVMDGVMFYV